MRVKELSHQVKLEVDIIVNRLSSHIKDVTVSVLLDSSRQQRVQSSVNFLLNSFNEHELTHRNGGSKGVQVPWLSQLDDDQVLRLRLSYPSGSLQLRINKQRPSLT